jgi:hypothetical protein
VCSFLYTLAPLTVPLLPEGRDAPQEGSLFLQRAAGVNTKLRLTLPDLAVRDRLCGAIVTDICRHIADAYLTSGMPAMAERWNTYIDTIDTRFRSLPCCIAAPSPSAATPATSATI